MKSWNPSCRLAIAAALAFLCTYAATSGADNAGSTPGGEGASPAATAMPEKTPGTSEAVNAANEAPGAAADDDIDFSTLKKAADFAPANPAIFGKKHEEYVRETGLLAKSVHVVREMDEGDLYDRKMQHYAGQTTPVATVTGDRGVPSPPRRRSRHAASQPAGGMIFQVSFLAGTILIAIAAVIAARRGAPKPKVPLKESGVPKPANYVRLRRAKRDE